MSSSKHANGLLALSRAMERFGATLRQKFADARRVVFYTSKPWRVRGEGALLKRRRFFAVAVSVGLHALLVAFFLSDAASNISGAGTGTGGASSRSGAGPGIDAELVSVRETRSDSLTVKQPDPRNLADEEAVTKPVVSIARTAGALLYGPDTPNFMQVNEESIPNVNATTGSLETKLTAGDTGQGGQTVGVDDVLWKQIEPCWRRLAGSGMRSTMLRVTFSPLGNITQSSNMSTADANSQATAAEALAECGPYVSASSRENVVIAFPAVR